MPPSQNNRTLSQQGIPSSPQCGHRQRSDYASKVTRRDINISMQCLEIRKDCAARWRFSDQAPAIPLPIAPPLRFSRGGVGPRTGFESSAGDVLAKTLIRGRRPRTASRQPRPRPKVSLNSPEFRSRRPHTGRAGRDIKASTRRHLLPKPPPSSQAQYHKLATFALAHST